METIGTGAESKRLIGGGKWEMRGRRMKTREFGKIEE